MSRNECDKAFGKLKELISWANRDFSESDSREKIIDPLFIDCLGWSEEDIRRETHVHKGYLDYIFSIDGARKLVLETKKVGRAFNVPTSLSSRYYRIGGTISTDRKIARAIEQAQVHCITSGVRYGVVTNGHQYILFEAFKQGSDWRSGQCIVFRSLRDIAENFELFRNTLSKNAVEYGSLRRNISKEDLPQEFLRPIDDLRSRDSPITRNNLNPLIQPLIDHVFRDLIDESQLDVLKKCYVAQRQYQDAGVQISRRLDRPLSFVKKYKIGPPDSAKKYRVNVVVESDSKSERFQELYEEHEEFLRTKAPRGSITILMGGIGSGKTTFIHHFFNFVIKNPERKLWFYVNFLEASPDTSKIEDHILSSIVQDFERKYRNKLKEELNSVGLDTIKPDLKDITILFSMLTLKGYSISLVLDNVDQHSYVSSEYQERVFLIAKHLTERLKTITVLTLREESFFKSTMSGVLDSFHPSVFHISSPSCEKLIRSRIRYALDLLEKKDEEIGAMTRSYVKFGSSKDLVKMFFEILRNSLRYTRKVGNEILRFLEDVSGGNMRVALNFFGTFLVSGNTDVNEMLMIESYAREQGGYGYQIPFHHVIKSIILQHSRLYASSRSRIMNLFDVNSECTNSHFLHLRILNYLHNRLSYQRSQGRGYVEIDSIIQEGDRMMISKAAISDSLKRMVLFGLVQFENQSKRGYENATYVRITNTGVYYLNELAPKFIYLDLVWIDTPILGRELVRELLKHVIELRHVKTDRDLDERFERTELFLNYLKKMEEGEMRNKPEFKESDLTGKEFMPGIIKSYLEQKSYIKSKLRGYPSKTSD